MPATRLSDAEIGFEAGLDALDRMESGLGQFARTVPWACDALQKHGSLSPGKYEHLRRQFHLATGKNDIPSWTLGTQEIVGVVRGLRPGPHGPRMTVECRDGRRGLGPVPRRSTDVFRGALIKFTTDVAGVADDDPTFAFFRLPTTLEPAE